jgi:hypothetical protein
MSRQGQSITLSLRERDKEQLKAIAADLGITWGDKPNISKLIEAIARRQLLVLPNNDWTSQRIIALNQARVTLIDAGQIEPALEIAQLLLGRSELSIPLRQEIQTFVEAPASSWRQEIDRLILRQQSFQLNYRDATERLWTFTIRHARITLYEKRQYLECWCQETADNQDIEALKHNWCLRLDRIAEDAIISPLKLKWKPGLDSIEIEMHLLNRLAFAYNRKQEDPTDEWITEPQRYRRIIRQVFNTFWFTREIFRYGADCVVVSPPIIRDRFKQELLKMLEQYDE